MLCLSELGQIHASLVENIYEAYGQTVKQWIMDLLAGTEMPQAAVYTNAHDVAIVNKDPVTVAERNFISGFISEQPERSFQHVRVRRCGNGKRVSVINCHAPSSNKRRLTGLRRLTYLNTVYVTSGADPLTRRR